MLNIKFRKHCKFWVVYLPARKPLLDYLYEQCMYKINLAFKKFDRLDQQISCNRFFNYSRIKNVFLFSSLKNISFEKLQSMCSFGSVIVWTNLKFKLSFKNYRWIKVIDEDEHDDGTSRCMYKQKLIYFKEFVKFCFLFICYRWSPVVHRMVGNTNHLSIKFLYTRI